MMLSIHPSIHHAVIFHFRSVKPTCSQVIYCHNCLRGLKRGPVLLLRFFLKFFSFFYFLVTVDYVSYLSSVMSLIPAKCSLKPDTVTFIVH